MGIRTIFTKTTVTPTSTEKSSELNSHKVAFETNNTMSSTVFKFQSPRKYNVQLGSVTNENVRNNGYNVKNEKKSEKIKTPSTRKSRRLSMSKKNMSPVLEIQTTEQEEEAENRSNSRNDYSDHNFDPDNTDSTDDRLKITLSISHHILSILPTMSVFTFVVIVITTLTHQVKLNISPNTGLGDGKRSPESSSTFFQSVDRDGDGILKAQEVAFFLEDSIGGSSFDTTSEVNEEVNSLMRDLDRDENEGLDKGDVYAYWNHLESLLTAEEVKEWIENALQLPEYIGDIFKDNGVTGYDFPELVENDGLSLREDLGIHKPTFRKKILRHIQASLLGVGAVPDKIDLTFLRSTIESCSTVSFSWIKPNARGFPVHSYKVQRRHVDLYSSTNNIIEGLWKSDGLYESSSAIKSTSVSQWVNIYSGGEPQFHDNSLQLGHLYYYRIQAWNSVGRSEWVDIDISTHLTKKKCTKAPKTKTKEMILAMDRKPLSEDHSFWPHDVHDIFSNSFMLIDFIITFARLVFTLIAIAAAVMRLKRASAPSTMLSDITPMPWLIEFINRITNKCFGVSIFPIPSGSYEEESKHDISVKAVGLNGYMRGKNKAVLSELDTPSQRRKKFQRVSSEKSYNSTKSSSDNSLQQGRRKSLPVERSGSPQPKVEKPNDTRGSSQKNSGKKSKMFRSLLSRESLKNMDESKDNSSHSQQICSGLSSPSSLEPYDDYMTCNTCHKKYKMGKRYRHHCCRCLATFCHKHGKCTHSNFTSCKVPGTCICNVCLEAEDAQ